MIIKCAGSGRKAWARKTHVHRFCTSQRTAGSGKENKRLSQITSVRHTATFQGLSAFIEEDFICFPKELLFDVCMQAISRRQTELGFAWSRPFDGTTGHIC